MAVQISVGRSRDGAPLTLKQQQMLLVRARERGIRGEAKLLEYIEYDVDLGQYFQLDAFPQSKLQRLLDALDKLDREE